jgi:hypothetical protein
MWVRATSPQARVRARRLERRAQFRADLSWPVQQSVRSEAHPFDGRSPRRSLSTRPSAESIKASSYVRPRRKAGHMTASDHCSSRKKFLQAGGDPHMRWCLTRPSLVRFRASPLCSRLHWSLCERPVGQFALWTFKRAQIGASKAGLDTDQHHANFALGAARLLDHPRGI